MSDKPNDPVNPNHYNGTEVIDNMVVKFGKQAVYWFCILNAEKYRVRAGKKPNEPAEQDLAKADWYGKYALSLLPL